MFPLVTSDAGIHILGEDQLSKNEIDFNIASLPDGMQSFRRRAHRIGMVCNEIPDGSQARGIARFKSRILVNNKTAVIVWAKRDVDVGTSSWRRLVYRHRHDEWTYCKYEIGPECAPTRTCPPRKYN